MEQCRPLIGGDRDSLLCELYINERPKAALHIDGDGVAARHLKRVQAPVTRLATRHHDSGPSLCLAWGIVERGDKHAADLARQGQHLLVRKWSGCRPHRLPKGQECGISLTEARLGGRGIAGLKG